MTRFQQTVLLALALVAGRAGGAEPLREGDEAVVVVKAAPLQKGLDILTRIPNGTRLTVLRTRDGWVRARHTSNGATHEGWIDAGQVTLVAKPDIAKARKLPGHLIRFAELTIEGDLRDDDKESVADDPAKLQADWKDRAAELRELAKTDSRDLRPLVVEAATEVEWFLKLLRSMQEHPDFAGLPRDSISSFTVRNAAVLPELDLTEKSIAPKESLNVLKAKLVHSVDEQRAVALRAAGYLRRHGGPAIERGQALAVDFSEPLPFEGKRFFDETLVDPLDNPDRLRLTNITGVTLTNCVVEVKVVGAKESRSNVHFVPKWPAGQVRTARYFGGVEMGLKQAFRTTAPDVERVEVSISSEELSQEKIEYRYDVREREFVFREYVGRAKVGAGCERYKGVFADGYRVRVSFEAIPYVPSGRVTARIKRNGVWSESVVDVEKWKAGSEQSIDFPDENKMDVEPTDYEVDLEVRWGKQAFTRHFSWK